MTPKIKANRQVQGDDDRSCADATATNAVFTAVQVAINLQFLVDNSELSSAHERCEMRLRTEYEYRCMSKCYIMHKYACWGNTGNAGLTDVSFSLRNLQVMVERIRLLIASMEMSWLREASLTLA